MALNSLTERMGEQIDEIVRRRQQNWDYIKRAHQGSVHWLNVLKLSKSVILRSFPPEKLSKRIRRWFLLGLSFGRLLEISEGATLVRALSLLINEYEHFIAAKKDFPSAGGGKVLVDPSGLGGVGSDSSVGSIPFLFLGSSQSSAHMQAALAVAAAQQAQQSSGGSGGVGADGSMAKPTLRKVGKEVVYEYLQTSVICLPEHLDYCELVHSLCDCLCLIYSKFLDPSCQPPAVHEAILRLDRKMKALILTKISNDLTNDVAAPLLKSELRSMLNHAFVDERVSTMHARKFYMLDEADMGGVLEDEDGDQ